MKKHSLVGRILCLALLLTAGLAFFWLVLARIAARFSSGRPCPYALAWLVDNPLRRRYMGRILDRVGIQPGERVLEVGPGPGAFSVEAARRTGLGGSLLAVDIQPRMLTAVQGKVTAAGLANTATLLASGQGLPLNDGSLDRAFLVTVLPEIPDHRRALAELYRVLKPGGILSLTEEFLDPDYPLARTTTGWAQEAGFEPVERHGNWFVYTLNFRKPA